MTLLIGITTPDAVVIAGDSRTTFDTSPPKYSDNTDKVFPLTRYVCAATYGLAALGGVTIDRIVAGFRSSIRDSMDGTDVDTVAKAFGAFMDVKYTESVEHKQIRPGNTGIGFLVGGITPTDGKGTVRHLKFPNTPGPSGSIESITTDNPKVLWVPTAVALYRLKFGFDIRLRNHVLTQSKRQDGVSLRELEWEFCANSLEEAVLLAKNLICIEILCQSFNRLPKKGVGGDIDIVTITKSGCSWVPNNKRRSRLEAPSQAGHNATS